MTVPTESPSVTSSGGTLLVIGAGLIGTSLGLAAGAAGYRVFLDDPDADRLALAASVGAGERWQRDRVADLAVVATPPADVATVTAGVLRDGLAAMVTHVCSVQTQPQRELEALCGEQAMFVGSHPIAGRERSGPHHASADLFDQRPWVVCPTDASSPAALEAVVRLARECGGVVTTMSAAAHDTLFAQLSHVPQLVASALAAPLRDLDRAQVAMAGAGLRDTTRIADSDPRLWAEIVVANPASVAAALRAVLAPLQTLLDRLDRGEDAAVGAAVTALVQAGREGRDRLGGKHGQRAVRWDTVAVVVPDEPGRLARLLRDAAASGVNVEDIRVDHAAGQPLGIVELDVAPGESDPLARELVAAGWSVSGLVS